jgi:hypothetical protein
MSFPPVSTAASLGPVAEVLSALMINGATNPTQAAQQAVAQLSQEYCGAIAAETSETDPGTPASPDCSDGGMAAANAAYPQFLAYYSQLPASFWGGTAVPYNYVAPVTTPVTQPVSQPSQSQPSSSNIGSGVVTTPVVTTATLENTSAPGQPFVAGDSFTLTIIGSPGVAVNEISSTQNGNSMGGAAFGSTDSTGTLLISGTFSQNDVGNWSESWQAGSGAPAQISFRVGAAPSQGSPGSQQTTQQTAPVQASPVASLALPSFLTNDVNLFGMDLPVWGLIAAGLVLLVVMPKKL